MKSVRWMILAVLALAVGRAEAQTPQGVREVAATLARKVRDVAGSLKPAQTAVRIGLFTPEGDAVEIGASGGAFLPELEQELKGFLDPKASLQLNGKILFVDDPEN